MPHAPIRRDFSESAALCLPARPRCRCPWASGCDNDLVHDDNKWFLPEDRPYIETFNRYKAADAPTRIDLSLIPEPWVGRLEAPIVLLSLNPGVAVDDPQWHGSTMLQDHIQKNLRQEVREWPFHYLHPDLKDSPGGKWWQRCLKAFIDAAGGGEEGARRVAERVVGVEFAGYHSVSFEPLPVTLPSQRWMFSLLTEKLE